MAENTHIEWTDDTWNPITGCSVVSPGCTNCYAMKLSGTRLRHHPSRAGLTIPSKAGPVWNGQVRFNEQWLDQPMRRKRSRMIFVCAHGDLFHENVPDEWIDRIFAVMALSPQHTFQVLTKRSARMREWFAERWQPAPAHKLPDGFPIPAETQGETRRTQVERACEPLLEAHGLVDIDKDELWTEDGRCKAMQWGWPLPNVWLGVSAEDQARADERIPDLLATPAAVRFLSAEPLLGQLDLLVTDSRGHEISALRGLACDPTDPDAPDLVYRTGKLDWVIVGGESGHGARPMHPEWARSLRDQCTRAGVPFFFKQWGEWGMPTDELGRLDWPYHPDHDRTHWFDSRTCARPIEQGWSDKYHGGGGALDPGVDLWSSPEYLDQVARCPQASCRGTGRCQGNEMRAAVTWVGKKRAGRLLDGVEHNGMPQPCEVPAHG